MNHRLLLLLFVLCAELGRSSPANAQIAIFNANLSAQPGEAVSLQGNFSAKAKAYCFKGLASTPVLLPILAQSANQATVRIPQSIGLDFYRIWVEDQGQRSPTVNVNHALGMHYDSPEVTPGGNLRIFGRNLKLPGLSARAYLIAEGTIQTLEAWVDNGKSDAYKLILRLPTNLQPGKAYALVVNNGRGVFRLEKTVTAIASGVDHFQLGVGWAAKLNFYANVYNVKTDPRLTLKAVGNGLANDQPAIQKAIDRASADGGGIVYLPAGTYKLTYEYFEYIHMRRRVVLQGAGKDRTFLKFGYDTGAHHMGIFWPDKASQAGLADLAMINIDNTGSELIGNVRGNRASEVFLQRVRFDLNRGDWLELSNCDRLVIANSDFTQGVDSRTHYHGPLQLNESKDFVITNNTITYAVDGINLNFARNGVFENNRVRRDGSARYPNEVTNHVLILNFAQNIALLNNTLQVINGPAQDKNDGEAIIAEGGGPDRIDEQTGTTTAATPTTLQDNAKTWNGFRLRPVVAIVSGRGMGQWRTITSGQGSTLTLERAWDVVPGAGSRYAIFNWGSVNWLVQGNRLEGNRRGVTLYHNATHQVVIVGNTLVNSGSIDLTPVQQVRPETNAQHFVPMYNNQIVGNTVVNTNGANGVFIGVHTVQHAQERTFGTSVIGLEVRNNTLQAGRPNTPAIVDDVFPEGYLNYLEYHPLTFYYDEQIPAILGSIFENNTAINCDNALHLNTGSYNTVVCNLKVQNGKNAIKDTPLDRTSHASVETGSCTPKASAPTTPIVGTGTGLRGDYFANKTLAAPLALSRVDTTVNFNWDTQAPAGAVPADNYSVRWSGQVEAPVTGSYVFSTTSDDGVRLWVNGVQVINNWTNHVPTTNNSLTIGLLSGQKYDIRLEYFENDRGALVSLLWSYPGQSQQVVPKRQLYPTAVGSGRVAAEDDEPTQRLAVYPVPAREKITLRYVTGTDGEAFVQLINPSGQAMRHLRQDVKVGENLIELEVADLNRGVYVLSLTQTGQRLTRRVILIE